MKYFYLDVNDFNDALKENCRSLIAAHQRTDVPLNFEICSSDHVADVFIYLSNTDVGVSVRPHMLHAAMEKIASFTNNDLNCGCTFTIG